MIVKKLDLTCKSSFRTKDAAIYGVLNVLTLHNVDLCKRRSKIFNYHQKERMLYVFQLFSYDTRLMSYVISLLYYVFTYFVMFPNAFLCCWIFSYDPY